MQIINMTALDRAQTTQAITILKDSFPIWLPAQEDAVSAMDECLLPENTMLAAVEDGAVLGLGGILAPMYDGRVFELHPLAIRRDRQRQGIGRALVTALEDEAKKQGGLTVYLGADDEEGESSLARVDLYDGLPEKLAGFTAGTHPSGFYLKIGYTLVGVMPDANGYGKPDIIFAKRL